MCQTQSKRKNNQPQTTASKTELPGDSGIRDRNVWESGQTRGYEKLETHCPSSTGFKKGGWSLGTFITNYPLGPQVPQGICFCFCFASFEFASFEFPKEAKGACIMDPSQGIPGSSKS